MSKRTVILVLAALAFLIVFGVVQAQEQEYALAAPTLTATEVDGEIVLSWTEVEGATRYDLRVWDCVNKWQRLGEDDWETTEAAHTDPADGITYRYSVQALNDRGEKSDWAAMSKNGNQYEFVRETVNPIPFPDFDVVAQDDHIQLQYSNVEKAVGYQARVWYQGAGDSWLWLPEADLESRTFSYFDVEPDVNYFFLMRSYSENRCGFSDWSGYKVHTFAGGTGSAESTTGGGITDGATGASRTEDTPTPTATATATATATQSTDDPDRETTVVGVADTPTPTATATATATATQSTDDPDRETTVVGVADTPTPTATATATATPTETVTGESGRSVGGIVRTHSPWSRNSVTLHWRKPNEAPVNYQVNWAEAGQSYSEGSEAYTTSLQYRITGLKQEVAYKVRVRARYNGSDGPWSTGTIPVFTAPE